MFSMISPFEMADMYYDYCDECEEKGIEPLPPKEWWDSLGDED